MDDGQLGAANRELLQRAKVALASLNNLLGTLLDSARLDLNGIAPRVADFPIDALLDRIGPEFGSVARSAGLELKFMSCKAWVQTDMHLLETMLRNFVSNAIRYTARGRVLVGCRRRPAEICVHDTGIGIEGRHLKRIFEEYYQVPMTERPRDAGIGLGLLDRQPDRTAPGGGVLGRVDSRQRLAILGQGSVWHGARGRDCAGCLES